jgi:alpha/beta superfamily hydrolase
MTAPSERPLIIESDGLRLEGMFHEGDGSLAAVVLHPHPMYGGDMDNHVVSRLVAIFADVGASTLRFNFRGAGRSQGTFDNGVGEAADARAAAETLRVRRPDSSLILAGYSFGAAIACAIAESVIPAALILVSPPVGVLALEPSLPDIPVLAITGERDSIAPAATLRGLARPGFTVVTVPNADHGWGPGLEVLASEARAFIKTIS